MENEHVCITDEGLLQMKKDIKNPIKQEEIRQKMEEIQGCVFCKRKWRLFWANEPMPNSSNKMSAEKILSGAQEEMVEAAARRLLEIDMINPKIIKGIIDEVFGNLAPQNAASLVLQRTKEIYAVKK